MLLHRPGVEIERMTPLNAAHCLYSDILNKVSVDQEYRNFCGVLERWTNVYYVEDILEKAEKEWFTGKSDEYKNIDCLIVDEAQFLSAKQVDAFARIVDQLNVPVICYGLRTDFTGHLFEGSQRLFEVANRLEEVPTVCWCGKKAVFNARVKDGKMVRTGEQIMMGGNESYITVCRKHFFEGQLFPPTSLN